MVSVCKMLVKGVAPKPKDQLMFPDVFVVKIAFKVLSHDQLAPLLTDKGGGFALTHIPSFKLARSDAFGATMYTGCSLHEIRVYEIFREYADLYKSLCPDDKHMQRA